MDEYSALQRTGPPICAAVLDEPGRHCTICYEPELKSYSSYNCIYFIYSEKTNGLAQKADLLLSRTSFVGEGEIGQTVNDYKIPFNSKRSMLLLDTYEDCTL